MAQESYYQEFSGYWRESEWRGLPTSSGIYCIYACTHDVQAGTVSLRKLLYIGESENVRKRVPEDFSERRDVWAKPLLRGEELCANFASITPVGGRRRDEAAMIYHHQSTCNKEYKDSFRYDRTTIQTNGRNLFLASRLTVE